MNYIRIIHPYIRKTQVILTYAFYLSLISRRPVPSFRLSVLPRSGYCRHTPLCHSEERSDAGISFSIMYCYHNMRLPRLLAKPRNDSAEYAITMPPHPRCVIPMVSIATPLHIVFPRSAATRESPSPFPSENYFLFFALKTAEQTNNITAVYVRVIKTQGTMSE